ncbi:MAG: hydantoinase B/oxoprolinase family protein, partial [Pirellulaceae bacterium]
NQGIMEPVILILPDCFLNAQPGPDPRNSPAIVGGNVETSQRVVDVILGALQLAAASQGTMNNWLIGDDSFGYYETVGGGTGATGQSGGVDAIHSHMTNTRLTDPEVLEYRYPLILREFGIRDDSGGAGKHRGGNGMVRRVEFRRPMTLSLLTSRRNSQPWGLHRGEPGESGRNLLRRCNGDTEILDSRCQLAVTPGDELVLLTPGGGAWGISED